MKVSSFRTITANIELTQVELEALIQAHKDWFWVLGERSHAYAFTGCQVYQFTITKEEEAVVLRGAKTP